MKYAHWIAKKCKLPLVVHLADHSPEFERSSSAEYPSRSIETRLHNRGNEVQV